MKALFLILLLPIVGLSFPSHDYHHAFMEMEFNTQSMRFEATLKVTAHDLAYITSKKHQKDYSIDYILKDSILHQEIEALILSGISLWNQDQTVFFTIEHCEINTLGDLLFYLHSEPIQEVNKLFFAFPLLSNYFPDQQNKLTYLKRGKQQAVTFLPSDHRKEIPEIL